MKARVRQPRRPLRLVVLPVLLAAAALLLGACGSKEEIDGGEGVTVDLQGVGYEVQISRTLNPDDEQDRSYLRGQATLPPDREWFGVFLEVRNGTGAALRIPSDIRVVDTTDRQYRRIETPDAGSLALDFQRPLRPGKGAPVPDSLAATSPESGGLVLFQITEQTVQNRPLELVIPPASGSGPKAHITLDI